jgi:hypothetical protein
MTTKGVILSLVLDLAGYIADELEQYDDGNDGEPTEWDGRCAEDWRSMTAIEAMEAGDDCYICETPFPLDQWELNCYGYCAQIHALRNVYRSIK